MSAHLLPAFLTNRSFLWGGGFADLVLLVQVLKIHRIHIPYQPREPVEAIFEFMGDGIGMNSRPRDGAALGAASGQFEESGEDRHQPRQQFRSVSNRFRQWLTVPVCLQGYIEVLAPVL
jgi:hypothetical protein